MFGRFRNAPGSDEPVLGRVSSQAIGQVRTAAGTVSVGRAGGAAARLAVGDVLYRGDAVETAADGRVSISFVDGTIFRLSGNARVVLTEFACDSSRTASSAVLSLARGAFALLAGRIAEAGSVSIDTPLGRIRSSGQGWGTGILSLAALVFSVGEVFAGPTDDSFWDDGVITYKDLHHGVFDIVTKGDNPQTYTVEDPAETLVVGPTVERVLNSSTRMAQLQSDQQSALATYALGMTQGPTTTGSHDSPIFHDFIPGFTPINFSPPPIIDTPPPNTNTGPTALTLPTIFVPPPDPGPIAKASSITLTEDHTYVFQINDFGYSDPTDVDPIASVTIKSLPGTGTLVLNGQAVTVGQVISAADISQHHLTFVPNTDVTSPGSFTFQVTDSIGHITSANAATMTLNVTPDAGPSAVNSAVTVTEDHTYVFQTKDFGYSDTADVTADPLASVTIASLPGTGALYLNGHAVTLGQVISATEISAGHLTFVPNTDVTSQGSFTFQVTDTIGHTTSANAATMTLNVTPDAGPSAVNSAVTVTEDHTYVFQTKDFGYSDTADVTADPLASVTIASLPGTGALYLNSHAVTLGQVISATEISAGHLTFVPNTDVTSQGSFTFQVTDTIGHTTSANAATMTLNVTPDAGPSAVNSAVTVTEDHTYVFQTKDFGYSDSADATADPLASVTIASLPGTGALYLNGHAVTLGQVITATEIGAGHLTFVPNTDVTSQGSFTFQVTDTIGHTTSATAATMTLNVTPDAGPSAVDSAVTVTEDHTYVFQTKDFGYSDSADATADPLASVTIASLPVTGTLYLNGHAVTLGQVITATDIGAGHLTFVPTDLDTAGSFTFRVTDTSGHTTSANAATMTLNVAPEAVTVTIVGAPALGEIVRALVTDADNDVPASGIHYQWSDNGVPIIGATAATFLVSAANAGDVLTVAASFTDASGNHEAGTSGPVTVLATTDRWIDSHSADWTHGGSWSTGHAPNATQDALIAGHSDGDGDGNDTATTVTIDSSGDVAHSLTVGSNAIVLDSGGGDLNLGAGGLTVANGVFELWGGTLEAGTIYVQSGGEMWSKGNYTLSEAIWNDGLIEVGIDSHGHGTLQIAGTVAGAGTIRVDNGATLQFNVSDTIAGSLVDNGTVDVHAGKLEIVHASSGTGIFKIEAGAALQFDSADSLNVTFAAGTGELVLNDPTHFTGTIAGLTGADQIDLSNINWASAHAGTSYSSSTHLTTLTISDGLHADTLHLAGDYTSSTWTFSSDGHGGAIVVDPPAPVVAGNTPPATPGNDQFVFNAGFGHDNVPGFDHSGDIKHVDQPIFHALADLLTQSAEAHVDGIGQFHDTHATAPADVQKDKTPFDFIFHT